MDEEARKAHWQHVYSTRSEAEVSWFQQDPQLAVELILQHAGKAPASVIDIGGGASRLVDALLLRGFTDLAVLDVSQAALESARSRLGPAANRIEWIVVDVTSWRPNRTFDVWHDRAAFHFLVEPASRAAYVGNLTRALKPGGTAIIATFALDGPEKCSGLPIVRYDPGSLAAEIGDGFRLVDSRVEHHVTPWGAVQSFQYSVLVRSS